MGHSSMSGGSTHEGNVDLLSSDQKSFLKGILGSNKSGANKAYRDLLKKAKEPNLDKLLGRSKDTYKDLMKKDDTGKKYLKKMSPSIATYKDFMKQGIDQSAFKTGVVDPMMQQYNQQVLPSVQQRFTDLNAGSSSALNQALASSANDLTTQMGQMYLPFMQNQQQNKLAAASGLSNLYLPYMQQMQQQQNTRMGAAQGYAGLSNPYMDIYRTQSGNRLNALSGLGGLVAQQRFTPMIHQQQGLAGPLIGAAGTIGAAHMLAPAAIAMSSIKTKENIFPYEKGLEIVKNLDVKSYDYKSEFGGIKNKVGVISEELPDELCTDLNGIRCVDTYGLISILINSVKELEEKVARLEKI